MDFIIVSPLLGEYICLRDLFELFCYFGLNAELVK